MRRRTVLGAAIAGACGVAGGLFDGGGAHAAPRTTEHFAAGGATERRAGRDTMRFLWVRGSTVLVEVGPHRVLIDPCLAPNLGFSAAVLCPPPALSPAALGTVDLILVTSSGAPALDATTLAALTNKEAVVVVGTARSAAVARQSGFRRVHVAAAFDRLPWRGGEVVASPAQGPLGDGGVGFRVALAERAFWHTGVVGSLDAAPVADASGTGVSEDPVLRFARAHNAEVVFYPAQTLRAWNAPMTQGTEGLVLAALAQARYAVPLMLDVRLVGPVATALRLEPTSTAVPPAVALRVVPPTVGAWHRVP